MTRFLLILGGACLFAATALLARPAIAQEIEVRGPLAGAPAVVGMRKYREMRLQVQVHGGLTLTDEFSQTVFTGGQVMFHPFDWLGVGVWGGYGVAHIDTPLTDEVTSKGIVTERNVLSLPVPANFPNQIGQIKWMAAPQVSFIPLRGKLSLFDSLFLDTDLHLFGGVAFVGLEERVDVPAGTCTAGGATSLSQQIAQCAPTQTRESRTAIAPTFGAGISLYLTQFMALSLEWRAFPFSWNTSGTDEVGDVRQSGAINEDDRVGHFNHMFSLGLAFYLPTSPRLSEQDREEND